jgi:SAM-dependent methyltransferase
MVYRPVAQPVIARGEEWDSHDYGNHARLETFYGERRQYAHRRLVAAVTTRVGEGRWLDIGCGTGQLLAEAARAGFHTVGVDLSPAAVARARARGLTVICGSFPEDLPPEPYDVISIVYTLEYVTEVAATLRACKTHLVAGGLLVLQAKNLRFWRYAERLFRSRAGIWCPQDLYTFSPRTITALLGRSGFAVERILPAPLPGRPLVNAAFGAFQAVSRMMVAPGMVVFGRHADDHDARWPVHVRAS